MHSKRPSKWIGIVHFLKAFNISAYSSFSKLFRSGTHLWLWSAYRVGGVLPRWHFSYKWPFARTLDTWRTPIDFTICSAKNERVLLSPSRFQAVISHLCGFCADSSIWLQVDLNYLCCLTQRVRSTHKLEHRHAMVMWYSKFSYLVGHHNIEIGHIVVRSRILKMVKILSETIYRDRRPLKRRKNVTTLLPLFHARGLSTSCVVVSTRDGIQKSIERQLVWPEQSTSWRSIDECDDPVWRCLALR